jgi:hypothetical protein
MTNIWLIGIVAFFAGILINRSIMTKALRKLDDETKLRFIDVFTRRGNLMGIVTIALVIVYLVGMQMFPWQRTTLTIIYMVLLIGFMSVKFVINYRKLKSIGAPPDYFRSFFAAYGVFLGGILAFVGCGLWVTIYG